MDKKEVRIEADKTDINPTDGQKIAGNYKKGHIRINGYSITIENPKGSYRSGHDRDGKKWKTKMRNDYGYFTQTVGKDGDAIDVFIGNNYGSKRIFVVDQRVNGEFDESKVMFCFADKDSAEKGYLSNYDEGWKGLWKITEVDDDTFKRWLYDGHRQRKPFHQYKDIKEKQLFIRKGSKDAMNETKLLKKSISALCEAVNADDYDEVDRLIGIVNEKYGLFLESKNAPYEYRTFKEAKDALDECLGSLYTNNKKILKEFATLIKGDRNLRSEYEFVDRVGRYSLDGGEDEYLNECMSSLSGIDRKTLGESNRKLFEALNRNGIKPGERKEGYIAECEAFENLIADRRAEGDINSFIDGKMRVKTYMVENKVVRKTNKADISSLVGEYVELQDINLNEAEKKIVNILSNGTDAELRELFESLKNDCRAIIREMLDKCSADERGDVMEMMSKIESKSYDKDGKDGIIKLIDINEVIN